MRKPPQFHQVIFDSLHEGLYSIDKNFRITGFNESAEKITGFKKEDVLGQFCKNVMRSDRCKEGCPIAYSLELKENVKNYNMVIKDKDSKALPLKVNAAIFRDEQEEPVGGVVVFRTVNELDLINQGVLKRMEFESIIGQNRIMQEVYTLIEEITYSNAAVLIQGESGTGKELVANAIQQTSIRKNKPYIKVNCSVFSHNLLASELFGHVKGAYTDAHKDRVGRFEMADGGTIFLDEIAETDPRIQLQLLRVLQEGTFERVGESVTRRVDVRVLAATNLDIHKAIADGRFRDDLYYRLNVIPLEVPPLRDRKDDIPLLVDHFLRKLSLHTGKKITEIDDTTMSILMDYDWPGNIRELENVIEYSHTRTQGKSITEDKLPPALKQSRTAIPKTFHLKSDSFTEMDKIKSALEEVRWNRSKAAEKLGMGRATLWRKMKAYNLLQ
jgi:PAS domain S-box-containing protein